MWHMSNVKSPWGCRSLRWRIRRSANKCDLRIRFSATTGQFRDGFDTIHVLSVVDIKVYRLVLAHECWPKKRCIYLQYGAYLDPETTSNRLSVVFYTRNIWHMSNNEFFLPLYIAVHRSRSNLKSAKNLRKILRRRNYLKRVFLCYETSVFRIRHHGCVHNSRYRRIGSGFRG